MGQPPAVQAAAPKVDMPRGARDRNARGLGVLAVGHDFTTSAAVSVGTLPASMLRA